MTEFSYAAFVSYSSKDAVFARRMMNALERYVLPRDLATSPIAGSSRPGRIYPICRDREELPAGELGPLIEANIATSAVLIVVCSPHAAQSPWVSREIEHFLSLGREGRVLTIISDSAPVVKPDGGDPTSAFFPSLLRGTAEPLAADARNGKDGFRNAILKIVAGIAGLNLGRLVDRDAAARQGRMLRFGAVGFIITLVMTVLSVAWLLESRNARQIADERLKVEMREAFESADYPRGTSLLAHLHGTKVLGEKYDRVLASWLARYHPFQLSLEAAAASFSSERRWYWKHAGNITGLPFSTDKLVVTHPTLQISVAMDEAGRLWEIKTTDRELKLSPLQSKEFSSYVWDQATILNSGAVILYGALQSSSAGGASPSLLFINAARTHYAIIESDSGWSGDEDKIHVSPDCAVMEWSGQRKEEEFETGIQTEHQFEYGGSAKLRFHLNGTGQPEEIAEFTPDLGLLSWEPSPIEAFAEACGTRMAFTSMPEGEPDLSPPLKIDVEDWHSISLPADASAAGNAEIYVRIYDAVQRSRLVEGSFSEENDYASYLEASFERMLFAGDGFPPVLVHVAADGSKYGFFLMCQMADAEVARCGGVQVHGNAGSLRNLGRYVYIADIAFLGFPVFRLFDRVTGRLIDMAFPELQGYWGPDGEAIALSPDGTRLATIIDRRLMIIGLHETEGPTLLDWFETPALRNLPETSNKRSADEPMAITFRFLDNDRVVGVGLDGRTFAIDLKKREDLWQFRVPGTNGGDTAPDIALSPDGSRIAIRTCETLTVLDGQNGLPLAPAFAFRVDNYKGCRDASSYERSDTVESMPETTPTLGTGCGFAREEPCIPLKALRPLGEWVARQNSKPAVRAFVEGFVVYAPHNSYLYAFKEPVRVGEAVIAETRCRTGWRVIDGRTVRYNPLAGLIIGQPTPLSTLSRCP